MPKMRWVPQASHLHFLEYLKPFYFANSEMIQINILKGRKKCKDVKSNLFLYQEDTETYQCIYVKEFTQNKCIDGIDRRNTFII